MIIDSLVIMKNHKNIHIIFILLMLQLTTIITISAQKIIKSQGEAQVRMEQNMTENETRQQAEELAKINAIENAFGTYTAQQIDMTIKDGMTSYNIIGTTKVKGDWIETTNIKFTEDFKKSKTKNGIINTKYITCNIIGKVRESVPKAILEYEILNGTNLLSRTSSFYHEEQLYVFFKSPVSGYISIFLEDNEAVYRLLPYINMSDNYQSGVPINNDTDYLFFSPDDNSFPGNSVDEPRLLTLKTDIEYNFIYIVFSEDEYVKPMLDNSSLVNDRIIPKQLSKKKFQQWLANNRASSNSFQDIKVKVSIEQRN